MNCKKRIWLICSVLCIMLLAACGEKDQNKVQNGNENVNEDELSQDESSVGVDGEEAPSEEREKGYLSDLDIEPLYLSFLHGQIQLPNTSYLSQSTEGYNQSISVLADEEYENNEFEGAVKQFALCDLNKNGTDELIFKMEAGKYQLIYILGIQNGELTCYDAFEIHTSGLSEYEVFENGYVLRLFTVEEIFVEYDSDGTGLQKLHFEGYQEGDPTYEYYYESPDGLTKHYLESNEEYEAKLAEYTGNELKWYNCDDFMDIPKSSSDIEK